MSTALKSSCQCNCQPCSCACPTGPGCLPDSCPPRPCFFDGQLITADDMNAMMTYFRAKNALITKLVSGWGVLGGMRVDAAPGVQHLPLASSALSPNPQVLAGTTLSIGAGVAADVRGNMLTLCADRIVDALELARQSPATPLEQACAAWFPGLRIGACGPDDRLVASDFLVVAVRKESPARPVPQFSGGGACDPAPSCEFSRTLEDVDIQLVPTTSVNLGTYLLTGCLDPVELPFGPGMDARSGAVTFASAPANTDTCQIVDALNEVIVNLCCEHPAVVLGRILLTSEPGSLRGNLPRVPTYTIVQDFYPVRRVVTPNSLTCLLARARRDGVTVAPVSDGGRVL